MAKYLLDTNHLSHALRKVSVLRDRLRQAVRQGDRFATCWAVLCELEVGIRQTARPETIRRTLHTLLKDIRIWPITWDVVNAYGEFRLWTKSQGKVLSHVDLLLASFAVSTNGILLTSDQDFQGIPSIQTQNWLEGS